MKVVIVGGVAGGASAAARIRRLDEHAQIIMIERSGYVSYANCGLPYYVGGVIKEQEELTLQTSESFWDRFRIDVRIRQEVTAINSAEKTVTIVQRPKQLLAPLDADMASFVHTEMRRHGVALRLGETVTGFRQDGDSVLTLLK